MDNESRRSPPPYSTQVFGSMIAVADRDVLHLWKTVGQLKGLTNDSQVARFLLSLYFSGKQEGEASLPSSRCVHCSTPLTWCCLTCLALSRQPTPVLPSVARPPSQQSAMTAGRQESGGVSRQRDIPMPKTGDCGIKAECEEDMDCDDEDQNSTEDKDAGDYDSLTDEEPSFQPTSLETRQSTTRNVLTLPEWDTVSALKQPPRKKMKGRPPDRRNKLEKTGASSERSLPSSLEAGSESPPGDKLLDESKAPKGSPAQSYHFKDKYPICDGQHFKDGCIPPFKHFTEYRCSKCNKTFHYKESLKRHMRRPDCDFTGEVIPSWAMKRRSGQKSDRKESEEDLVLSDHEGTAHSGDSGCNGNKTNDAELSMSQCEYYFHPATDCTLEEFMTGRIQILMGSSSSPGSNQANLYSHYHCEKCCKVFVSKQEYNSHRRKYVKEGEDGLLCSESKPERTGPDLDSIQILTDIKERLLLCCPHCSHVFANQREHLAHVNSHNYTITSDGNHVCNFCGESYRKRISILTHQSIRKNLRVCKNCGFCFRSNCQIKDHMKMHSQGAKCETCGESFDCMSKAEVKQHLKTHKEKPVSLCPICGKAISKPGLTSHMLTHDDKRPFSCSQCNKSFKHRLALENHEKIHSKTFQCETCGAYFSHSTSLKAHIDFKHLGKFVECQECGKKLSRNMTLLKHIRLVHRKIKPFSCSMCGFTCACRKQLNEHVRSHTGEKPYQCQFCPSRFARRDYLKQHVRTHTGEKPYACEDCGQRFICRTSLTLHRKNRHSDKTFPCSVCGQEFHLQSSLDYHCFNEHGGKYPATTDQLHTQDHSSVEKNPSPPVSSIPPLVSLLSGSSEKDSSGAGQ